MRNYVQMFWGKINWDNDINPPNPPVPVVEYFMNPNTGDLDLNMNEELAAIRAVPTATNIVSTVKGPIYWLLDKVNCSLIFAFAANTTLTLIDQGFSPAYIYNGPFNTPRDGWTDGDGVKRVPPPSERSAAARAKIKIDISGAAGLLAALAAIPTLAATFTSEGRLRDAGICMYAFNQVANGSWAITQALQYLDDNINF